MRRVYMENLDKRKEVYIIDRNHREFNHIKNVLRIKRDDVLEGFNGNGLIAEMIVENVGKNKIFLKAMNFVLKKRRDSRISIAVSVVKPKYFNLLLKSVVQIGVKKIYPFISEYSYINNVNSEKIEKWNELIIEGAKQSGNNSLTFIEKLYNFNDIKQIDSMLKFFFHHSGESIYSVVENLDFKAKDLFIVVGPEGGFSEDEVFQMKSCGFSGISLNFNTMRTETAVISILTLMKFLLGEA